MPVSRRGPYWAEGAAGHPLTLAEEVRGRGEAAVSSERGGGGASLNHKQRRQGLSADIAAEFRRDVAATARVVAAPQDVAATARGVAATARIRCSHIPP